ncbi:noroxomaritidine/norcraugsodine reductase isoform X1 [Manihot esculenta]|uniref:Tropinone reductase I n=1 Tax=Manihot esculenta TaxID=3983 RepID=A0A2C9VEK1_MANES|nr:noroxomaritidine/norcraugsodine reductase isoform X1 [Manihot esculenta]
MAETELGCRDQRWSLKGRTALVTGGTRGIGYAIVEELAGFGARVHICSRNEKELKERTEEWKSKGFDVSFSVCDLTSRAQREKLIDTVSSVFDGKLNILVNNAATVRLKNCLNYNMEDYSTITTTNLESPYHLCQLSHPLLKASGNGSIVFISSIAGEVALPMISLYAATKGAINQLTKNLACEWAQDNIRANTVSPSGTRTSVMQESSFVIGSSRFEGVWGDVRPNSNCARCRAQRGFIAGGVPLSSCSFLHYWASYMCGWRINCQRFFAK